MCSPPTWESFSYQYWAVIKFYTCLGFCLLFSNIFVQYIYNQKGNLPSCVSFYLICQGLLSRASPQNSSTLEHSLHFSPPEIKVTILHSPWIHYIYYIQHAIMLVTRIFILCSFPKFSKPIYHPMCMHWNPSSSTWSSVWAIYMSQFDHRRFCTPHTMVYNVLCTYSSDRK